MHLLLSYPKSGRTWVFSMLGKYVSLEQGLGDIDIVRYATENLPLTKSHAGFSIQGNLKQDRKRADSFDPEKIILLTRNPYDTVLSFYHDAKGRYNYSGDLESFIRHPKYGANNLKRYTEYVDSRDPRHIFSYEDIQKNTFEEMKRILEILEQPVVDSTLNDAIEFCAADNLREQEQLYRKDKSKGVNMKSEGDMVKVRKAKVGSYKEEMTQEQINYIKGVMNESINH